MFAVYGGIGLGTTTDLNKLVPNITIGFQNKQGDIISGSMGTDKSIQVGYIHRFINIKK